MIVWKITSLDKEAMREGSADVVLSIHWEVFDSEHPEEKISSVTGLMHDPDAPFVQYADLTEEIVFSWLFSYINKDYYENMLTQKLNKAQASKAITSGLPW